MKRREAALMGMRVIRNVITRTYERELDQAIADLEKRGYVLEKKGQVRRPSDDSVVWQAGMMKEMVAK
jgi:hypothetical protein